MKSVSLSFLLTILAGFSTMIGCLFLFIKDKDKRKIISSSLSFASGVMICVSITDLIPESISLLRTSLSERGVILISFLGIMLGIIISIIIDYYLPDSDTKYDKRLYKVGLVSMIAIIIHNIPEGIITFLAGTTNIKLGITLTLAIAVHNIPEGISISIPVYYSTGNMKKAFLYTLISALSEPFGAILAYLFIKDIVSNIILGIMFSLVAGIMLEISIIKLIPLSLSYNNKKLFIIFFLLGILFMFLKFII